MNVEVYNKLKVEASLKNISYEEYKSILIRSGYTFPETIRCEVDRLTILYIIRKFFKEDRRSSERNAKGFGEESMNNGLWNNYVGGADY